MQKETKKIEFPFVSRKKYNNMKNNYRVASESARVAREAFTNYQKATIDKNEEQEAMIRDYADKNVALQLEINNLKKEKKSLKTKLTNAKKKLEAYEGVVENED